MKLRSVSRSGFTLLEIMLVVMIIALLLAAGINIIRGNLEFAQDTRTKGDIQSISSQLRMYQAMNGFLPSTEQGLEALINRPNSEPKPRQWRQLLSKEPVDGWHKPFVYLNPGKKNPNSFDLYSMGPDGKPDTEDDIGNWDK
jgi:general secretion pathway protein G